MPQGKAEVNAFDVIHAVAANRIHPHALVTRSADGTITLNTATTDEQYQGVANDMSIANDDDPGFYSQYDTVPVITRGRVRLFAIGGGTNITSGNYLQAQPEGMVAVETNGNRTLESVAKAVYPDDIDVATFTTGLTTPAVGDRQITVTSTANFAVGDYVYLTGASDTEVDLIESIDSATTLTLERAVGVDVGINAALDLCVPVEAVLL